MDTTATMDARTAAALGDETFRAPLPGLVMGDAAVGARRRHGWPGKLFIGMSSVTALGVGGGVLALGLFLAGQSRGASIYFPWQRMLLAAAWCVLQWRLAREVRRFSRWGWYGAMAELGAATLAKLGLALFAPFAVPWTLPVMAANLAWMRYFWKRRADFDVDLGG
jgi:hypothetical protein